MCGYVGVGGGGGASGVHAAAEDESRVRAGVLQPGDVAHGRGAVPGGRGRLPHRHTVREAPCGARGCRRLAGAASCRAPRVAALSEAPQRGSLNQLRPAPAHSACVRDGPVWVADCEGTRLKYDVARPY